MKKLSPLGFWPLNTSDKVELRNSYVLSLPFSLLLYQFFLQCFIKKKEKYFHPKLIVFCWLKLCLDSLFFANLSIRFVWLILLIYFTIQLIFITIYGLHYAF